MEKESSSKPASRLNFQSIIFGILIGIPITMVGMLIYINYFDQINNLLLYVLLVVFGVVVATLVLLWGFKPYLTRLLFGSKVADSPDLIAEAQSIASELSDGVIEKVMENATEEQREKAKGLVLRLGNWFVWGRLRNWWWNWILGIFVSLGGLTGTLLLVNQNELLMKQNDLLSGQNNLVANQTKLLSKQNELIQNQMALEEANRRGALVVLMSNIFDKVDDEIALQKAGMIKKGEKVNDDTKFMISQSLIGQIAALSEAFKPYRFMDGDTLIKRPLSPERGQLLVTITRLPLHMSSIKRLYKQTTFENADLRGTNLSGANLSEADLSEADLSEADLSGANLSRANLREAYLEEANLEEANLNTAYLGGANLSGVDLNGSKLRGAYLGGANLRNAYLYGVDLILADLTEANLMEADLTGTNLRSTDLSVTNLSGVNLSKANLRDADLEKADLWGANLSRTNLSGANLSNADLRETYNLSIDQITMASNLRECKLPKNIDVEKLRKGKPELFESHSTWSRFDNVELLKDTIK